MAKSTDPVSKPADRDKALSAAYLRMMGNTQAKSARAAGVGSRTLERWEKCSWWAEICEEASDRWLAGVKQLTRQAAAKILNGDDPDPATVRFVLERLFREFEPPRTRHELTGKDGRDLAATVVILPPKEEPR